jgi:signal transduction histidine kinase
MRNFIHSKRKIVDQRRIHDPQQILKIILVGTFICVFLLFLLLCFSFFIEKNFYLESRIIIGAGVLEYILFAALLVKKQYLKTVAWMLIGLYGLLATSLLFIWGLNTPIGILVLSFLMLLGGVLLGSRYIIPVLSIIIVILVSLQIATFYGLVHPDLSALSTPSGFGDVISYSVVFVIIALISWLSRKQMEQSLLRALDAEAELVKEKELLAIRLEEKTQRLRALQIEEMRQLYRFAELGQVSSALLHDLANHLTVLTLDIDDLSQRHTKTQAVQRAKESITHLDTMVDQVRRQLKEETIVRHFDIVKLLDETIENLQPKALKHHTSLEFKKSFSKKLSIMGDSLRLSQIITVIITNALEAYTEDKRHLKPILVELSVNESIHISVTDWGKGIDEEWRKTLFEPFKTTKKHGMGIGLFIAKSMLETHFKGKIFLDDRRDQTTFHIEIPFTDIEK